MHYPLSFLRQAVEPKTSALRLKHADVDLSLLRLFTQCLLQLQMLLLLLRTLHQMLSNLSDLAD